MKTPIYIATLIAVCVTSGAYAAKHRHSTSHSCWYETDYGEKDKGQNWAYYFCGKASSKCDGKKHKGHDKLVVHYHGDSFTFKTSPYDKYWCCGGTGEKSGTFVKDTGKGFYIDTQTKRKQLADGGSCNIRVQKTICGDVEEIDCTEPDTCSQGFTLRNKACIKPCGDDEVFESDTSNTCIKCETTPYQGIHTISRQITTTSATATKTVTVTEKRCLKCDKDTEFFNRQTKTCIKKSSLEQHSKQTLNECWRCPQELEIYSACVKAITQVNKMGKTGEERLKEINAIASFAGPEDIVSKCHLRQ